MDFMNINVVVIIFCLLISVSCWMKRSYCFGSSALLDYSVQLLFIKIIWDVGFILFYINLLKLNLSFGSHYSVKAIVSISLISSG